MGGQSFFVIGKGATAKAAFDELVEDARHEYGHGGYTGTIAEKNRFVMAEVPVSEFDLDVYDAENALLNLCLASDDHRLRALAHAVTNGFPYDKWGPAYCVKLAPGTWAFFGDAPA